VRSEGRTSAQSSRPVAGHRDARVSGGASRRGGATRQRGASCRGEVHRDKRDEESQRRLQWKRGEAVICGKRLNVNLEGDRA
jgi:hypothetical protein